MITGLILNSMQEKKQHGGYRPGSGRPKGEEKVRMWIPVSKIEAVKKLINKPCKK